MSLASTDFLSFHRHTPTTCLCLVVPATSVAMLATTPRSARPLSAFATTVSLTLSSLDSRSSVARTIQLTLATGKQPGHESNQCPLPRTTEAKQCYHCQGLGHVQADCPTLRLSGAGAGGGRCYNCNQPGHLAVSRASVSVPPCLVLTIPLSKLIARLPQPSRRWYWPWWPSWSRWFRWFPPRRLPGHSSLCNLLQVRWPQPFCA